VVSPWTNSVIGLSVVPELEDVELDLLETTLKSYVPRLASEEDDIAHFNSLLWTNKRLHVAAHTFGDGSFIVSLDRTSLQPASIDRGMGSSIHSLACHDGELFWLSSGTGEIRSSRGLCAAISREGYARGFAVTDDHFIVAVSQFLSRQERTAGDSWIQIIERRGLHVAREYHLPDTGSINDLRLMDEYDYAHQLPPLWGGR